ncbi:uncharacterized protein LOC142591115 [Dermacentor variabilis]|uniref:uncharacterized protein LOC142591115 n=1 Tax=Dermacentor variabilis TaxID=34621 RepID=UPI003F5C8C18
MKLQPLLVVSFIFLSEPRVTILGADSGTEEGPDFEKAFPPNARYLLSFQNFYLEENERHRWCASLWRLQNNTENKLHVRYTLDGKTEKGIADLLFFSSTGSSNRNAANVSNATPDDFKPLNTDGVPYMLLYADGARCMVVRIPEAKTTGVAQAHGKKDGAKGHCVILVQGNLHRNISSVLSCITEYNALCNPWKSHRVNNTQCVNI